MPKHAKRTTHTGAAKQAPPTPGNNKAVVFETNAQQQLLPPRPLGVTQCARIHLNLGHALVGPRSEQAWPMLCDGSRLWNSLLLICLPHHAPTISWFLKVLLTSDMLSKSSLCVGTLIGHKRAVSIDGERYIVDNFLCHCGQMRN